MTTSTEAQQKTFRITYDSKPPIDTGHIQSSNHQEWLPYQIAGGKTKNNVQIDSQKTEIWSIKLNVTL